MAISVLQTGTPQQLENWYCNQDGHFILETKEKFYPLLQELSYIRPLTFASPNAFAEGLDSNPDTHNSCNPGDFGSKWSELENEVTCAGLSSPSGTGPFKLVTQETVDGIDIQSVFASHDEYWGVVPDIDFLHLQYYENTEDVESDLLSGDLDMALGIGPLNAKQVQDLKFFHSDVVDVRHSDILQHSLLVMNTNREYTNDVNVRRAVIHAVDKAEFIENEFAGLEQPVSQLLPYTAPYCNVDLSPKLSYDYEKAVLLNCPLEPIQQNKSLGSGAIAGIAVAAVVIVALVGLVTRMIAGEKKGKPMFASVPEEKEIA
jgi:nickel transport system substrate-binding protein